jgi:hypothetical protein
MNRIIWHHTAGRYTPNGIDLNAYHRLIDGSGVVHDGKHPISANAPGRPLLPGTYAAHTRNLNSGSIGVSLCAMHRGDWFHPYEGECPVLPVQVDVLIAETARLCRAYGIEAGPRTTLSHAEVEPTLGVAQANKWDLDYDPRGNPGPRDPVAVGDVLRAELVLALGGRPAPAPAPDRPTLRQGSTGRYVREMQGLLGVSVDGQFGPNTRAALVRFQSRRQLLPDGICGPASWSALLGDDG